MRETVEKLLRRWGDQLILRRTNGDLAFSGLLRHTGSRSWQNMEKVYSPLGRIPRGQYTLIAPVEPLLREGDVLLREGKCYGIQRLEVEWLWGKKLFQWGLCVEIGGEDFWGSRS